MTVGQPLRPEPMEPPPPANADYLGYEHQQLEQMLQNMDPSQVDETASAWRRLGVAFEAFGTDLAVAAAATETEWQGEAGDRARMYASDLGTWFSETGQAATKGGEDVSVLPAVGTSTRHSMPPPVDFSMADAVLMIASEPNPLRLPFVVGQVQQRFDEKQMAHREAAMLVERYDDTLYASAGHLYEFTPPPVMRGEHQPVPPWPPVPPEVEPGDGGGDRNKISWPTEDPGDRTDPGQDRDPGTDQLTQDRNQTTDKQSVDLSEQRRPVTPPVTPQRPVLPPVGPEFPQGPQFVGPGRGPGGAGGPGGRPGGFGGRGPGGFGAQGPGGFGPHGSGAGSGVPARGLPGPGALAAENAAGRPAAAGSGGRGMPGGGMPMGGGRGEGDGDGEHQRPAYLIEPDPDEVFGTDEMTAPPVIGE